MKKLLYLLLVLFVIISCKDDENDFSASPTEIHETVQGEQLDVNTAAAEKYKPINVESFLSSKFSKAFEKPDVDLATGQVESQPTVMDSLSINEGVQFSIEDTTYYTIPYKYLAGDGFINLHIKEEPDLVTAYKLKYITGANYPEDPHDFSVEVLPFNNLSDVDLGVFSVAVECEMQLVLIDVRCTGNGHWPGDDACICATSNTCEPADTIYVLFEVCSDGSVTQIPTSGSTPSNEPSDSPTGGGSTGPSNDPVPVPDDPQTGDEGGGSSGPSSPTYSPSPTTTPIFPDDVQCPDNDFNGNCAEDAYETCVGNDCWQFCGSYTACSPEDNARYQLTQQLSLTPEQGSWLFHPDNSDIHDGIMDFLAPYGDQNEQVNNAAAAVVRMGFNNLLESSPYNPEQAALAEQILRTAYSGELPEDETDLLWLSQMVALTYGALVYEWKLENCTNFPTEDCSIPFGRKSQLFTKATYLVFIDPLHVALDVCGLVVDLCDPINGVIYLIEGDGINAAISFSATIPIAGWTATTAKYLGISVKVGTKFKNLKVYKNASGLLTFSHNSSSSFRKLLQMTGSAWADYQAHHIIPKQLWDHPVIQKAASAGKNTFHMNHPNNGVPIHTNFHSGSHPNYTSQIVEWLEPYKNNINSYTPNQLAEIINEKQGLWKSFLENTDTHIEQVILP